MEHVIEDILHYLVDTVGVDNADNAILLSISRQVKKGTALTDRQYELVKNKIQDHKEVLAEHNILVGNEIPTRLPIRSIDRSKYITVLEYEDLFKDTPVESAFAQNYAKTKWIKVRFPFSKKDIARLESIKVAKNQYRHDKGSHEHYFCLTAKNIYQICKAFEGRNFEIDEDLIELYKKVSDIQDKKDQYVPHTKDGIVFNVPSYVAEYIESVSNEHNRKLICADRSIMFGYQSNYDLDFSLADCIASRTTVDFSASPGLYTSADIVDAVNTLNRFPVVVLIDNDNNAFEQLKTFYNEFLKYVPAEQQSVLFREDGESAIAELNHFVKDKNLNNWVDNTTKIVYIKKNKLPKVLIGNEFKPITAVSSTSLRLNNIVESYVKFNCDLVLFNDDVKNFFNKWSYGGYV